VAENVCRHGLRDVAVRQLICIGLQLRATALMEGE